MMRTVETKLPHAQRGKEGNIAKCGATYGQAFPVAPSSFSQHFREMQQTRGNQAVQRLLREHILQTKLTINQPGDRYEQEAERVADQVMRMELPDAAPLVGTLDPRGLPLQRKCAACEEEERVQRKANDGGVEVAPAIVDEVLDLQGQPLDEATRAFFEPRFGRDFGNVRIHCDQHATESAHAVNARAYTAGNDVVFAAGEYSPSTRDGRQLLAHELSHVVQQSASNVIQRKAPDSKPSKSRQTNATDDYIQAETYLTDFYDNEDKIVLDVYLHASNAVHEFGHYSSIKDKEGSEPPIATIKAVLGLIPDAAEILEVIEMVEKGLAIAKEVGGLVQKPEKTTNVHEATAEALTKAVAPFTKQRELLSKKRKGDRQYLEGLHADPKNQGKLLPSIQAYLGPLRPYNADVITKFGLEYELELYKEYFVQNVWIDHIPPFGLWDPHTKYVIVMPDMHLYVAGPLTEAEKRILLLFRQLGHTAKVSISTRFSEKDPDYAEVVKILLDWGVKLYWLGGTGSNKPETLHTGADLEQPYRGERFREVK